MQWSKQQVELLVARWSEGRPARLIAEELGAGFTKNSVIGKAHRLDLQHGEGPSGKVVVGEPEAPPVPDIAPISDDMQNWMCRWRTDEPGRFGLHICGKTVQPGRDYCAEHCTEAYLIRSRSAIAA